MAADAADELIKMRVQLDGTAEAVTAISRMEEEIAGGADAVRELQAKLRIMQSQKSVDVEQFRSLTAALEAQQAKLAESQAAYVAMGGSAAEAGRVAAGGMDAITAAAERAAAAIERAAEREKAARDKSAADVARAAAQRVTDAVNAAEREGAAREAAVKEQLRASVAAFNAEVAAAEKASEAKRRVAEKAAREAEQAAERQASANQQGLAALREVLTGIGGPIGAAVGGSLELSEKFGQMTPRIKAIAIGLSLAAVAAVGLTIAFKSLFSLGRALISAADPTGKLAAEVDELKKNVAGLFKDAKVKPFVDALRNAFSLFSQNTAIGQKLRGLMSGMMTEFFAAAALVLPYVKEGFVGILIVGVQVYIWLRKLTKAVEEMIGPIEDLGGMEAALLAGKVAAVALLVVIVAIGAAVALLMLPWIVLGAAIYGAYRAVVAVIGAIKGALAGVDLSGLAMGMIDGLVAGITGRIGKVVGAVRGLATSAVNEMKTILDSHSPSEVFREIGDTGIGGGLVLGMGDAEGDVQEGVDELVDPRVVKAESKAARSGGGSRIVYIEKLYVRDEDNFLVKLEGYFEVARLDGSTA